MDDRYYFYCLRLQSLIGKCSCEKFDPINSNVSDVLDEVSAFLKARIFTKELKIDECESLLKLYEKAIDLYEERYLENSIHHSGSWDDYIDAFSIAKEYVLKGRKINGGDAKDSEC